MAKFSYFGSSTLANGGVTCLDEESVLVSPSKTHNSNRSDTQSLKLVWAVHFFSIYKATVSANLGK